MKLQPTNPAMKFPNTYGNHLYTEKWLLYVYDNAQKNVILEALGELCRIHDHTFELWRGMSVDEVVIIAHMTDMSSHTNYTVHIPFDILEHDASPYKDHMREFDVYSNVNSHFPLMHAHDVNYEKFRYVSDTLRKEITEIAVWRIRKELECLR